MNSRLQNINIKLSTSIMTLLSNMALDMTFYGEFALYLIFHKNDNIDTCGVNVSKNKMHLYYNDDFLDKLSQKECNFVLLHELFHLFYNHQQRVVVGNYNPKLANIAQDAIINTIIMNDISSDYVSIPHRNDGKPMVITMDKDYNGKLLFEEYYEYLYNKMKKWEKNELDEDDVMCDVFLDIKTKKCSGEYLDKHIENDDQDKTKDFTIMGIVQSLKNRGLYSKDIGMTIDKLHRKDKDYLKYIKHILNTDIFGVVKHKTYARMNRLNIDGLKGNIKHNITINCVLDTSGSMCGTFDKLLTYIYQNDININLIECDTEVRITKNIKNKNRLNKIEIQGLGGTILQPSIDIISRKYNKYCTLIMTDGYCDILDFNGIKNNILVLTIGKEVFYKNAHRNVKQIKIHF